MSEVPWTLPAACLGSEYPRAPERELGCETDHREDTLLPEVVQSAVAEEEQMPSKAEDQDDPSEEVLLAVADLPVPVQAREHTGMGHMDWVLPVAVELVAHKGLQAAVVCFPGREVAAQTRNTVLAAAEMALARTYWKPGVRREERYKAKLCVA